MNRRWLIGMVVGMAVTLCVPAHAIVLRYTPKVGEVHKQKATFAGRMQTSVEGMGELMRMEMTLEMEYSERALSQTDAVTRVQTDLTRGTLTLTMGGQSQPRDLGVGKTVLDLDRQGNVVKIVEMDMPEAEQIMGPGAESWSFDIPFPEGDIAVNGTWSGTMTIPIGRDTPPIRLPYECTLLGLTTFQGRNCAKIRATFKGPFDMDLSGVEGIGADAEGPMNATMEGDLVYYYDYDNSVDVYGEGTVGMDMSMSMAELGAVTMKMLMNIKTALQP
ncbi:MAG: hypothetical protein MUQ56_13740 [Thermoleophilia bacterium]|nr:hypothetical protein [Thermoleophilia bacterium]